MSSIQKISFLAVLATFSHAEVLHPMHPENRDGHSRVTDDRELNKIDQNSHHHELNKIDQNFHFEICTNNLTKFRFAMLLFHIFSESEISFLGARSISRARQPFSKPVPAPTRNVITRIPTRTAKSPRLPKPMTSWIILMSMIRLAISPSTAHPKSRSRLTTTPSDPLPIWSPTYLSTTMCLSKTIYVIVIVATVRL